MSGVTKPHRRGEVTTPLTPYLGNSLDRTRHPVPPDRLPYEVVNRCRVTKSRAGRTEVLEDGGRNRSPILILSLPVTGNTQDSTPKRRNLEVSHLTDPSGIVEG